MTDRLKGAFQWEPELVYEGSNLQVRDITPAILKHLSLEPDAVDRVIAKRNSKGLFLEIEAGDKKARCLLYNVDDAPDTQDPEQVLTAILHRTDLTPEQRGMITSALHSFKNPAGSIDEIRWISALPLLSDCNARPIEYLEEPVLPAQSLVGVTGSSGDGKSTLMSAIAGRVAQRGVPVLILDGDNPLPVVIDRFDRLGITDGPLFHVWGGWCPSEPCQLDSGLLVTWVMSCEPKPLIILDSFGAFYDGDENDAGKMRAFLRPARRLVNLGATVVVLHNDGKSETAVDYRGSAAFKDSVDTAFHVSNSLKNGRLNRLTIRCYKSRYGFAGQVVYQYADGRMQLADKTAGTTDVPGDGSADKLAQLLVQSPGMNTRAFIAAAKGIVSEGKARRYLTDGIAAGRIKREGGKNGGYRHFLVEEVS